MCSKIIIMIDIHVLFGNIISVLYACDYLLCARLVRNFKSIPPRVANEHLIVNPSFLGDVFVSRSSKVTLLGESNYYSRPIREGKLRKGERDESGRSTYIELFRVASLIHLNKSWLRSWRVPATAIMTGSRPFGLIARDGIFSTRNAAIPRDVAKWRSLICKGFVFGYIPRQNGKTQSNFVHLEKIKKKHTKLF